MPSEVAKQPATEVIPLPTSGRMKLQLAFVAPTAVGAVPPVEAPPAQAEVAAAVTGETQSDATMAVPEAAL